MHHRYRRGALAAGLAGLLLLSACSDDSDDADDTETEDTETGDTTSSTTAGGGEEAMAFCEDLVATDKSITAASEGTGTPEDALAALDAVEASVPDDLADEAAVAVEFGRTSFEDPENSGPPTPEFNAAYTALVDFTVDECDFQAVDVSTQEYSFGGVPEEIEAGPTALRVTNGGEEFHEMLVLRVNDDVTESIEELLALPEEEATAATTTVGGAFAPIGDTAATVLDLEAGRYVAICFLPVGATQEAWDQMMSGGAEPAGGPHAMEGMYAEFNVS